jgi:MFS family permease
MVVYGVVVPILPHLLDELGIGPGVTGILFACYAIGLIIACPFFGVCFFHATLCRAEWLRGRRDKLAGSGPALSPCVILLITFSSPTDAGYISDRYNTRQIPLLLGLFGLGVATIAFGLATDLWALILARIFQGISSGATWAIGLAMLADIYPTEQLGSIMGIALSGNTIGFLSGPPLGGVLYEYVGYSTPFFICAGLAFLDLLIRLFIVPPKPIASTVVTSNGFEQLPEEVDEGPTGVASLSPPNNSDDAVDKQIQGQEAIKEGPFDIQTLGPVEYNALDDDHEPRRERSASVASDTSSQGDPRRPLLDPNASAAQPAEPMRKPVSYWQLIKNVDILVTCGTTAVAGGMLAGLEPTLPLHLEKQYQLGQSLISVLFTCMIIPNVLVSIGAGALSDRIGRKTVSAIGLVLLVVMFPLAGSSYRVPVDRTASIVLITIALSLAGASSAVALTPTMPELAEIVSKMGGGAYGKAYALFNMAYSVRFFFIFFSSLP